MIMQVTCMQPALHMHKKLCTVFIPLCRKNLNLPVCSFFLPCAWLPPLFHHVFMVATSLHCTAQIFLFICLNRYRFCSPAINQTSLSQSKGWFPFILCCRWEKYHWTGPLGLYIKCANKISEIYQYMYLLKNYLNGTNIGQVWFTHI